MTPRAPIHKHRNLLGRVAPRRDYGPRSAAPVGARDRDRSRRPARPGRPAATVLVVGLLLLLGAAAAAEAQTAPSVLVVNRVSVDGTYTLGDTISLSVAFSAAVTVTGTPQLALVIGTDTTPRANYASGSGTQVLQFDYQVVAGDEDADGITVPGNALTLNGGTISASGTAAALATITITFLGILVDAVVAPTVTGIALTSAPGSDNTYAIGDAVTATVTFDAAVDITGSPQLELDFAGTAKAAACATGTNTTTMACSYTVAVGDSAPNGVAIAANTLTGGTITATGSTTLTADLAHVAVAIDAGHKVDGIRPTLVTTGDEAPTTSTDGTQVILTFSEDLSAFNLNVLGLTVGGVASQQAGATVSRSGRTVTITLLSNVTIAAGETVTMQFAANVVEDAAGNGSLRVTGTIAVINAVPAPTVSGVALTSAPGSDNTYGIGDVIEATVAFSEGVDITGTPQLELDFDGTPKAATCLADTNTSTIGCYYTVAVNDSAPNGIAIGANTLTGGTIYATGSTTATADLDHGAVAIDAGQKVDGSRPTLVTTGTEAPTTSTDGTKIILFFNEFIGTVDRTKITVKSGTTTQATPLGSVLSGPRLEIALATALTSADTAVTVELGADAVTDGASNGNLAVAATAVTNAIGSTTAPTVTGIALTSTPTYAAYGRGDDVEATVTFDAAVDITGTPQLELDFDGTAKAAACAAATNTTAMVCRYTVAPGDSAPNGIAIAANTLTGGTITATGDTTISADLDHAAVPIDAGHKVDGIRPTLVTTGTEAPTTSTDGTTVTLTFSEDIRPVNRNLITIQANGATLSTTGADRTGNKAELTLATALTATATNLTVALASNSVFDTAGNGILAVTAVAATARLPLLAPSVTASAPSSTVTAVSALVRAVARAISNLGPDNTDPSGVACVVVPDFTVILVRSTVPMNSLKKRMIFVPSVDVVGALLPVVTSVGRMPSTLWSASIPTAT